jgi:class 3 adenylate cyclase/DNA-binding response OmpR family regulator
MYRILIVEDSKAIGSILYKTLGRIIPGSQIEWTQTVADSKEMLTTEEFDYIILDIFLPDGEGSSLISWSKSINRFRSKWIIFTTSEDSELKDKMLSSGVLDFILKSGNVVNVAGEIKDLIEKLERYRDFVVLVVDDASVYRNMLRNIFINRNYRVVLAKDGAEALGILKQTKVDIILMDLNMPNMNGKEFLQKRRGDPSIYQIPTIMITGENEKDVVSNLLRIGANDVIAKPFIPEEVIMKVNNLIELMLFQREKDNLTQELKVNIDRLNDINGKLSKYLSPQLHSTIFENREVNVSSKRKKLTIFFSDIVDFTKTVEEMEPEDLTGYLNSYLTEMSAIALKYGATIDKYIGDAIVAFFGDPTTLGAKEDAIQATNMAIEMRDKLKVMQENWRHEGFLHPFKVRMGIHTGYATVGNFGSENKIEYTAIGSSVNLSARLQSSAEVGTIVISDETYSLVKDNFIAIEREPIQMKGFANKIVTYSVLQGIEQNVLTAKLNGFYLNIDFNSVEDKSKILEIVEHIKESIEEEKSSEKES